MSPSVEPKPFSFDPAGMLTCVNGLRAGMEFWFYTPPGKLKNVRGVDKTCNDENKVKLVVRMIETGDAGNLLLGRV